MSIFHWYDWVVVAVFLRCALLYAFHKAYRLQEGTEEVLAVLLTILLWRGRWASDV